MSQKSTGESQVPDANAEMIVCFCYNVRRRQILEAMSRGALTLKEIQDQLNASTGCGGCEMDVREILEQFQKKEKPK